MKAYREVAGAKGAPASFRFEADGRATVWVLSEAYCEDPLCKGPEADVVLVAADDPARCIEFRFDFFESRANWRRGLSPVDTAIVEEFMRIRRVPRLLDRHRSLVRAWGLSRWRGGAVVPCEDRCYRLGDFDAKGDSHAIAFESGGRGWYAFDHHCVNPSCDCDELIVSFAQDGGKGTALPDELAVRLDLRGARGTEKTAFGAILSDSERRIVADFKEELGAWQAELGLRRQLVRDIASIRLRAAAVAPAPTTALAEAGRNDACPCGSGRKFKKCCGSGRGAGAAEPLVTVVPGALSKGRTRRK